MGPPDKRQHVVFAQAVKFGISHNHHIIVIDGEDGIVNQFGGSVR